MVSISLHPSILALVISCGDDDEKNVFVYLALMHFLDRGPE